MSKFKTNRSAKKRFKITANKKILRRITHQNHFNAKESGNKGRNKRGFKELSSEYKRDITSIIHLN